MREDRTPGYLRIPREEFERRIRILYERMERCDICPRNCGINRYTSTKGLCRMSATLKIASINLHFGEEPPISGKRGSGTIFFSGCPLRCKFCQNYPISQLLNGNYMTEEELAERMVELQERGAHNINLVTPSHFVPQIVKATYIAREMGLKIPLAYNTSGYDSVETLKLLEGIVDIYMPDIKYSDNYWARKLSSAPNYWDVVRPAVKEMYRQVGPLRMDEEGIAYRGVLIRHLVLPQNASGTEEVFRFIAEEVGKDVYISLMSQYFPTYKAIGDPVVGRRITYEEYHRAIELLHKYGLENGYIQEIYFYEM